MFGPSDWRGRKTPGGSREWLDAPWSRRLCGSQSVVSAALRAFVCGRAEHRAGANAQCPKCLKRAEVRPLCEREPDSDYSCARRARLSPGRACCSEIVRAFDPDSSCSFSDEQSTQAESSPHGSRHCCFASSRRRTSRPTHL